jgi:hypothetical protein
MAPIIQTVYIGEVDAFCLADQKGDIFTREEFQKLVIELEKFYDIISNDNITNSNEYRNNKSCNQQHMKIRKLKQAQRVYLIQKSRCGLWKKNDFLRLMNIGAGWKMEVNCLRRRRSWPVGASWFGNGGRIDHNVW